MKRIHQNPDIQEKQLYKFPPSEKSARRLWGARRNGEVGIGARQAAARPAMATASIMLLVPASARSSSRGVPVAVVGAARPNAIGDGGGRGGGGG